MKRARRLTKTGTVEVDRTRHLTMSNRRRLFKLALLVVAENERSLFNELQIISEKLFTKQDKTALDGEE